jgi:hypothetical protein
LRIYLIGSDEGASPYADIIVPVVFRGSLATVLTRLAIVGIGTAGSGMIAAYAAGKLSAGVAMLIIFFGFMTSVGTVFTSLRKP